MHKGVYLSLGSNVGDRAANLKTAIEQLGSLGKVIGSLIFLRNRAGRIHRSTLVSELRRRARHGKDAASNCSAAILDIEREMGRRRMQKKGPRNIDIDILLFGNSIVETQGADHPASRHARAPFRASNRWPKLRRRRGIRCSNGGAGIERRFAGGAGCESFCAKPRPRIYTDQQRIFLFRVLDLSLVGLIYPLRSIRENP